MSIPIFAIIGCPNVGKSTLFNRLTRSRQSLVIDAPGITRDRIYARSEVEGKPFVVIDTGGLEGQEVGIDNEMAKQSWAAVEEADAVFFVVDGRQGASSGDLKLAEHLRSHGKPLYLLVNKTDGLDPVVAMADFYQLGLGNPLPIAASQNRGVRSLIADAVEKYWQAREQALEQSDAETVKTKGIRIAIVGRPNVGKSTLVNRLLGEERVVVYDQPGTTRDSIAIEMERNGTFYTIVDTAGVRKRGKVTELVEKFSIVKTLQSIEEADVVIMMLDAQLGITEQDLNLLTIIEQAGRAMVIAMNKWDGLPAEVKDKTREELAYRLSFVNYIEQVTISALHGTGVGHLFEHAEKAYAAASKRLATPILTRCLEDAIQAHPPPMIRNRRIKLRYAHAGGICPPRIIIHGNQIDSVPDSYRRYLVGQFRKKFRLKGTPIVVEFKGGDNPFEGRRNELSQRQRNKRRRLKKFIQKNYGKN